MTEYLEARSNTYQQLIEENNNDGTIPSMEKLFFIVIRISEAFLETGETVHDVTEYMFVPEMDEHIIKVAIIDNFMCRDCISDLEISFEKSDHPQIIIANITKMIGFSHEIDHEH